MFSLGYEYLIRNTGVFVEGQISYGLTEIQQDQYLEQTNLYYLTSYSQKLAGTVKNLSGNVMLGIRRYF
jgi:hypothetical protein